MEGSKAVWLKEKRKNLDALFKVRRSKRPQYVLRCAGCGKKLRCSRPVRKIWFCKKCDGGV